MIRVFVCNSNSIILEGLKSFITSDSNMKIVGLKSQPDKLILELTQQKPDVLLIDYTSEYFDLSDIKKIRTIFPMLPMVGITDYKNKQVYSSALGMGLSGHVLNCCDKKEILDAIYSVFQGQHFFCGKVLAAIEQVEQQHAFNCDPISLTQRELEVITLIAEGLTNKEIADQLCLSSHTVMTHRKNMMSKLGITNTAGLVIFAVKQNLISPNKFLFETQVTAA